MIEAMKKYTFLVFHAEYEHFLKKLRNLGVVHIETREEALDDDTLARMNEIRHIKSVMNEMERLSEGETSEPLITDAEELLLAIEQKQNSITKLNHALVTAGKEADAAIPWGEFDTDVINGIKEAGYDVRFFICEEKNQGELLDADTRLEMVNHLQGEIYLMSVTSNNEEPVSNPNFEEVELAHPFSWYQSEVLLIQNELEAAHTGLREMAAQSVQVLNQHVLTLENELAYNMAVKSGEKEVEDSLYVLTGWVPAVKETVFNRDIDAEGLVYIADKAQPHDNMPVLLKNNKFARLFEVIGDLYTLPNHRELDLTPFFAPFYMLFFGFCLGDAGYGLLIVLATLYGMYKVKPKFKPLMKLGFFLGLATTIMGIVGGSFFGIMFGVKPDGTLMQSAQWLRAYQHYVLSTDNLMILALMLGYIQVTFGMILKAVNLGRMFGFKHSISQIGWIIIVAVTIPAYGLGRESIIPSETANMIAMISLIAGGIPALFYNTPGKNVFLNFGTGLWDTYGTVSGLLGDVLSYIRLFALGLSSSILGNVFNSLAMQTKEGTGEILGILFMILILAFGHGLNLFMALLGSFVHPLRLTFVEFFKNAGFEGGGKKYEPFTAK